MHNQIDLYFQYFHSLDSVINPFSSSYFIIRFVLFYSFNCFIKQFFTSIILLIWEKSLPLMKSFNRRPFKTVSFQFPHLLISRISIINIAFILHYIICYGFSTIYLSKGLASFESSSSVDELDCFWLRFVSRRWDNFEREGRTVISPSLIFIYLKIHFFLFFKSSFKKFHSIIRLVSYCFSIILLSRLSLFMLYSSIALNWPPLLTLDIFVFL